MILAEQIKDLLAALVAGMAAGFLWSLRGRKVLISKGRLFLRDVLWGLLTAGVICFFWFWLTRGLIRFAVFLWIGAGFALAVALVPTRPLQRPSRRRRRRQLYGPHKPGKLLTFCMSLMTRSWWRRKKIKNRNIS